MLDRSRTRFTMVSKSIPSTWVSSCAHIVNMVRPSTSIFSGEGKTAAGCEAARLIAASTSAGMGTGAGGGAGGKAACDDSGKGPATLPPTETTPYQGHSLAASSSCTAAAAAGDAAMGAPEPTAPQERRDWAGLTAGGGRIESINEYDCWRVH